MRVSGHTLSMGCSPGRFALLSLLVLAACSDGGGAGGAGASGGGDGGVGGALELPDPLGPLPPAASGESDRFVTSGACAQCHLSSEEVPLEDAAAQDLSPVGLWRTSMMALSARDPFYLAVFSHELDALGGAPLVEAACSRCHAPAASVEREPLGSSFADLTTDTSDLGHLARDGVTCSLCHQLLDSEIGSPATISGVFSVGASREIFGPHQNPDPAPMEFFVGFTPTFSEHVARAELCAGCHTVVTPILAEDGTPTDELFVEQAAFFEWENSAASESGSCGDCHMPRREADGSPTSSPLATYPEGLMTRSPIGRHSFAGANAWVQNLIADDVAWAGVSVSEEELRAAAATSEEHLGTAAEVAILSAELEGGALVCDVRVRNKTGHKLPTGYPTRRVWLHVVATDAGGVVLFESGAYDTNGAILGADGQPLDLSTPLPHEQQIAGPDDVLVYELVPLDRSGAVAHRPLAAVSVGKDNRLLPYGWREAYPWIDWIAPRGVEGDANFIGGSDRVEVLIGAGGAVARVDVELLYQTISPETLAALARVPTPAAVRFSQMAAARPPLPTVLARASLER